MQQPEGGAGALDSAFGGSGAASTAVEALRNVDYSWSGSLVAFALLVGVLFLRRLLPPDRQKRGRIALIFLVLSLLLRLSAIGLAMLEKDTAASVLGFISMLFFAFGVTGVIALLVFDIVLARFRVDVPELVRDVLQALAFAVITIGVLQGAGVNLIGLITTSAVLTAIIGLALQSTIANLFAGLTLQLDRTINVGEWVHAGDNTGRIVEIRWRSTLMVTKDGDLLIIPNGQLLGGVVKNYSRPSTSHRVWVKIGFAYRHSPNEVRKVLLDAARGAPGVLADPSPDVLLVDYADSAITYALRYWIDDYGRDAPVDHEVRTRIWYGAQRAELEIPFPIRTVFMNTVSDEQTARDQAREVTARGRMLADNELFSALSDADREMLAGLLRTERFTDGEIILRQGASGDSLYLIESGDVVIRLSVDGAEREVATLRAGQFFGEMALLTGEARTATVVALTDVECYRLDGKSFREIGRWASVNHERARTIAARINGDSRTREEREGPVRPDEEQP